MKKITTLLVLLIGVFTLSGCESEETNEPFKIQNFNIISIQTLIEDRVQYNSDYNAESTNNTLFANTKDIIVEYEFNLLDEPTMCESDTLLEFDVDTNNADLTFSKQCIVIDGENTLVTYVEIQDQAAYTEEELYNELRELF